MHVCNYMDHAYVVGQAAASWDSKSVDWVPTLHLGHEKFDPSSVAVKRSLRESRLQQRKRHIAEV